MRGLAGECGEAGEAGERWRALPSRPPTQRDIIPLRIPRRDGIRASSVGRRGALPPPPEIAAGNFGRATGLRPARPPQEEVTGVPSTARRTTMQPKQKEKRPSPPARNAPEHGAFSRLT